MDRRTMLLGTVATFTTVGMAALMPSGSVEAAILPVEKRSLLYLACVHCASTAVERVDETVKGRAAEFRCKRCGGEAKIKFSNSRPVDV
jgi:tRNA(Ile2) C34 agmatinyltransferase TiaS